MMEASCHPKVSSPPPLLHSPQKETVLEETQQKKPKHG